MYRGSKEIPKTRGTQKICVPVEEHSIRVEAVKATCSGVYRSENVGISSKKFDEKSNHRKPKVSWATIFDPGLGGPKRVSLARRAMDSRLIFLPY